MQRPPPPESAIDRSVPLDPVDLRARRRRLVRIYIGMAVAALTLEVLAPFDLAIAPHVSWARFGLVTTPFMALALIGSLLGFVITRPLRREWYSLLGVAVALGGLALLLQRDAPSEQRVKLLGAAGSWLGLSALVVLFGRFLRSKGATRDAALVALLSAAALPSFVTLTIGFLGLSVSLHPTVYDGYVYAADATFGIHPNLLVYRLFEALPPVLALSRLVYVVLPLAVAALYTLESTSARRPPVDTLLLFVTAGTSGFALYHLFPVVGPVCLFKGVTTPAWPAPETVALRTFFPDPEPRNCMPSLHTTWALLLFWQSRTHRPVVRVLAGVFLVFTVLATLGFGYHYACDLVAAVPFSLAVWAGCATAIPPVHRRASWGSSPRARALVAGVVLTALWFAVVRFGLPALRVSPLVPWSVSLAVMGASVALRHALVVSKAAAEERVRH